MPERNWTVLLIGGGVGAGKSTLARRLATHFEVNVIEGDLLRVVLLSAVSREAESDLHLFSERGVWWQPVDELLKRSLQADRYICGTTELVISRQIARNEPSVLEAVWISPEFALQKAFAGRSVTGDVRSLFVYEPNIDQLRGRFEHRGEWWSSVPPDERGARIEYFHAFGLEIKRQADALGLPVLESRPFDTLVDRALVALSS